MTKRTIKRRLEELERQSEGRTPVGEYWRRELSDDLEDPPEPWEEWFRGVDQ